MCTLSTLRKHINENGISEPKIKKNCETWRKNTSIVLLTWLTVDQCCKYVISGLAGEFVGGVQEDISVSDEIKKRC